MATPLLFAQPEKIVRLGGGERLLRKILYPLAGMACGLFHAIRSFSLMAPSVANPYFEGGGLSGYSHSHILSLITVKDAKNLLSPWVVVRASASKTQRDQDVVGCVSKARLAYPLIVRPDTESGTAGLSLVHTEEDLKNYAAAFPKGERFIVQEAVRPSLIAHIYYERRPDDDVGHIVSLALSYYPCVTGDGVRSVQELVLADPLWSADAAQYLSQCASDWNLVPAAGQQYRLTTVGASMDYMITQDSRELITPEITVYWDKICRSLPEFYAGCLTVGLQSSKDLKTGENVTLLTIKGPGFYPHILDGGMRVIDALKAINQSVYNAFAIGLVNKKRGHKPDHFIYVFAMWLKQIALRQAYPKVSV